MGLGDGDGEAFKAFIVECAFFISFSLSFFHSFLFSLRRSLLPFPSLSLLIPLSRAHPCSISSPLSNSLTIDMTEVARHSSGALRQRVVASAAVFARRHLFRRGLSALPPLPLALACLFLAAKVEESHVSARYLLTAAERAAESCFSVRGGGGGGQRGQGEEMKGGIGRSGNANNSISLVASSSIVSASQRDRNELPVSAAKGADAGPSPSKKALAPSSASSSSSSWRCPLPLPTMRQLLEAEVELVSSLGARGLLVWSPYPDALEAAAAIERERKTRETSSSESSGRRRRRKKKKQQGAAADADAVAAAPVPPLRLGARAWAAVSVSLARTDACLWAPPHVIGFAAAAVAAAAADDAERMAEEEGEEGEGEEEEAEEEAEEQGEEHSSSSFTAAATRWFSSVDVDLDQVAEVAVELCHAAGVEGAAAAGRGRAGDERSKRTNSDNDNGGGAQRVDAVARAFEFLRSGGVSAAAAAAL